MNKGAIRKSPDVIDGKMEVPTFKKEHMAFIAITALIVAICMTSSHVTNVNGVVESGSESTSHLFRRIEEVKPPYDEIECGSYWDSYLTDEDYDRLCSIEGLTGGRAKPGYDDNTRSAGGEDTLTMREETEETLRSENEIV